MSKICESCGEEMDSQYDEFVCDGCLALDEEETELAKEVFDNAFTNNPGIKKRYAPSK